MRYFHLFLILNFVLCYAGICGDTVMAVVVPQDAQESCHGSNHEMAGDDQSALGIESNSGEGSENAPCCLDYLNGSSTDNSSKVVTVIEILSASELFSKNIESQKLESYRICKGHDPPDLQISFSTFLL